MRAWFAGSVLAACVLAAAAQAPRAERYTAANPCISKQTCSECIRTPSCGWCYAKDMPESVEMRRCFQPSADKPTGDCDEKFVYYPTSVLYQSDPEYNKTLTGARRRESSSGGAYGASAAAGAAAAAAGEAGLNVVQVSPQRAKLSLRMNEAKSLSVFYSQAQDNPVDLYYLMDLSQSMANDKEKLSSLGDQLADTMQRLTTNFRLGFGSFVDKTVMPYISTIREKIDSPCPGCAKAYGFKNEMSLSINTSLFETAVRNAKVSGNLDAPEGGFDAIMQSIVCGEIGWREEARKLLVFSTDAGFHYAGDGKLGGIITPNDGECHMDKDNKYSYSHLQDYPSISQINYKVKQNNVNIIFAVTQEQISTYKKLEAHIEGSTSGVLKDDSSNVVDLVKENYDKITSSVEMSDNAKDHIKITYYSSCLGPGPARETKKCDGLHVGDVVEFRMDVSLLSCPADRSKWQQTVLIKPIGLSEALRLDLELLCDCPCERPTDVAYEAFSPVCNTHGTYACGVCDCLPGYHGHHCDCDVSGAGGNVTVNRCSPPGSDEPECSGRGHCNCGQCECDVLKDKNEVITGTYCECDNFSCDRKNNVLCSGPEHGSCVCGRCECNPDWTGDDCSCRNLNDTCINPANGLVCNNRGRCECGTCVCNQNNEDNNVYKGQYCSECLTCTHKCEEFRVCVLCQHFKQGLSEEECNKTCHYEIIPVPTLTRENEDDSSAYICTYRDENACLYSYKYEQTNPDQSDRTVYIEVQDKMECPPPVYVFGIVLGVIAAIVLIGLALLMLWKMVTTIHDRREFARFEKERAMAKWNTGENPIYKQATSTFKNPTYQGN